MTKDVLFDEKVFHFAYHLPSQSHDPQYLLTLSPVLILSTFNHSINTSHSSTTQNSDPNKAIMLAHDSTVMPGAKKSGN